MTVKQITKGQVGWWKNINDGLQELQNDMFHLETDWTSSGMVGINGFSVSSGQYKIIASNKTGFKIALINMTIKTPAVKTHQQMPFLALPFYVKNGAVIDTYPIQNGTDEFVRVQLTATSGNSVLSFDNASDKDLSADTLQIAMGIVWSL